MKEKTKGQLLLDVFFELKGWDYQPKEFYIENKISYPRNLKVANQVLELCDGDLEMATDKVNKIAAWADGSGLEWVFETVLKKWLEIEKLRV